MKIRTKLMLSMSILIVFILFSLLAVTHIQFLLSATLLIIKTKLPLICYNRNLSNIMPITMTLGKASTIKI